MTLPIRSNLINVWIFFSGHFPIIRHDGIFDPHRVTLFDSFPRDEITNLVLVTNQLLVANLPDIWERLTTHILSLADNLT